MDTALNYGDGRYHSLSSLPVVLQIMHGLQEALELLPEMGDGLLKREAQLSQSSQILLIILIKNSHSELLDGVPDVLSPDSHC